MRLVLRPSCRSEKGHLLWLTKRFPRVQSLTQLEEISIKSSSVTFSMFCWISFEPLTFVLVRCQSFLLVPFAAGTTARVSVNVKICFKISDGNFFAELKHELARTRPALTRFHDFETVAVDCSFKYEAWLTVLLLFERFVDHDWLQGNFCPHVESLSGRKSKVWRMEAQRRSLEKSADVSNDTDVSDESRKQIGGHVTYSAAKHLRWSRSLSALEANYLDQNENWA